MLIIVSGPSGTGKNTIIDALIKNNYNMELMKSCTTRPERKGGDNNYFHLTQEEFEAKKNRGEFFETEMVHQGLWYGVLNKSLEDVIKGDKMYIKDIDVKGAEKIANFLVGKTKVVRIFVDATDDVLKDRLAKRGETPEQIEKRLSRADFERGYKNKYDLVVNNNELNATVKLIQRYIDQRKNALI